MNIFEVNAGDFLHHALVLQFEKNKNDKIPYTILKLAMGTPAYLVYLVQETHLCIESLGKF